MAADLPSPPFKDIPGLPNFRDVGGYPIASQPGKEVRRGVLFRSAEPSQTTDEGVTRLQELGIAHVYDLRSDAERERDKKNNKDRPIKEWEGAERIEAPIFGKHDYSPKAIAERLERYKKGTEVSFHSLSAERHRDLWFGPRANMFPRVLSMFIWEFSRELWSLMPNPIVKFSDSWQATPGRFLCTARRARIGQV